MPGRRLPGQGRRRGVGSPARAGSSNPPGESPGEGIAAAAAARSLPTLIHCSISAGSAPAAMHSSAICRYLAASGLPSPKPSAVPARSASRSARPAAASVSSATAAASSSAVSRQPRACLATAPAIWA